MAGGGEEAKAGNAAGYTHAMSTAATTDGEFLLHLLRKGIRSNKNQTAVTTNSNNYTNKPTASSSASHSAEVEAWQLADPAVAAYGPSHPFHTTQIQSSSSNNNNNNSSNPHRWLNSFHHHRNRTEDSSSPCSLDPLLRPSLNPYDCWSHPSPFANYPEQFHKPYDKPLLPFPDRSFGGTPCGCGGASVPSCGNVHGPFAVPRVPEAPWMAGAAGVAREDRVWPLHPAGGAGIVQRPLSLFPGNEAVPPVNSGNYQNAFAGGGVWQLQKSESQFAGNGADFFEHLRGLSGMSENGFSMSGFVAPGGCDPCVGSLTGNGSQNAKGNRMCVGRNDAGPVGLVPSHSGAAVGSDIPEACGDRCFRFRPTALHSEHNMCITEGNPMNGIRQCDRKGIEMRSGDIILPKSELPLKLQGEADVVRVLSRPSSNQRVLEGRTVLEGVVCREDLKIRDACFPVRIVDDPIRRVAREGISSFEQGISEGTTWLGDGRRKTVVREETAFCTSNSVYVDDRRQAADRESAVEIEKDGSQNLVCRSGCGRSELMRRVGVRNGAVQQMVLNARQDRESTKELTDVDEDGEVTEMWSLKSQDRNIRKPQNDSKKYRGNQHEWHMKQLQAEDEMHCCDLDSFPTIAGHFSTLEANESDSCNLNDCLKKCSFRGIPQPDISSCSEPLAFWHENHCLPSGSKLHSASASTIEQSCKELHGGVLLERKHRIAIERRREGEHQMDSTRGRYDKIDKKDADGLLRELGGCLKLVDDSNSEVTNDNGNNLTGSRLCKDLGLDHHQVTLTANQHRRQRLMRPQRKEIQYRADLEMLTSKFLLLYQSLIPQKEEEAKRKQLISCLEKLINREWPGAQLHLFGSCANAFGVSNSDIDVCLSIDDEQSSKPELVLKLADILQSDDMQDVQALTHARVPIVKFTDPITDISCDICINNILAVVNTKLLHDYAQIDIRLQQLVLMVKHWAKCRQINETYRGTLSSYAYVLMCIHFLQQRKPAILPCLQEMETTYQVTIGKIECAYYDQVNKLNNYGAENKETLGQLLSAFFDYWAFRHDYTNSVISVRTGGLLSKHEKDWTRRIGNERHLICIEDPFETSHDLGRVVDKHSIRVLKEEFRRAAEIMQHDPDPCVTLFKPYTSS